MDLARVRGAGDEQLDAQHPPPALARQDGRHPRPHPLEVLGALHDPDEHDAARRDGAVGVAVHQVPQRRQLVRDADAAGDEHHGAVRRERARPRRAAVRPLDQGARHEPVVGRGGDPPVHAAGEAVALADDGADRGARRGEEGVEAPAAVRQRREALFGVGECGREGRGGGGGGGGGDFVGPGEAEGVRRPQADRGHGQEDVLARGEGPGAREVQRYAHCVAREQFEDGSGAAATEVAVDDADEADAALASVRDTKRRGEGWAERTSAAQRAMTILRQKRSGDSSRWYHKAARMVMTRAMCVCKKTS